MFNTALAFKDPAAREYANALSAGTALMEYRLERVLGAGGFGITYLGWDTHLEKHVAIKEYLPTQLAVRALDGCVVPIATEQKYDYAWGLERFVQEARTLARFSHAHIVRVIRYIEANGTAYMVMEYEAGQSLTQWLNANPHPDEHRLRALADPLLDGLEAMHAQGFLHRDIKPGNVFVRENGMPVLLDFGAARQAVGHKSMSLTSIVSPGYAPLEQYASDGNQGPWTDVYSFSAVIFRAVTGQNPPEAVSRMKIDRVGAYLDSAAARYSKTFLAAVKLGMAVDEKLRPQSVAELRPVLLGAGAAADAHALDASVRPRTTVVSAPSVTQRSRVRGPASAVSARRTRPEPQPRRWPWVMIAAAAAFAIAAGLLRSASAPTSGIAPATTLPRAASAQPERAPSVPQAAAAAPGPVAAPSVAPADPMQAPAAAVATDAPLPAGSPSPTAVEPFSPPINPHPRFEPGIVFPKAAPQLIKPPAKGHPAFMRDFQAADADGDGAISESEARARMPRLARDFEQVDANRDGRVTPIELQRFLHPGPLKGARP